MYILAGNASIHVLDPAHLAEVEQGTINVNSQAAFISLKECNFKSKLVIEFKEAQNVLMDNYKDRLCWLSSY